MKPAPITLDISNKIKRINFINESPLNARAASIFYSRNPINFINDFCMTYDPRQKTKVMPFLLYPRQREYIQWLHDKYVTKQDGCVLKCRDVGASWLNCAFAVWMWLFVENSTITFISRKEDYVDKIGDLRSILEKCRFIISNLPPFFMPAEKNKLIRHHLKFKLLINPKNGSSIVGESGDEAGRGGRSTLIFGDEFAFIPRDEKVEAAISQNSDVKIYVSTPNGCRGVFYNKIDKGVVDVFYFKWHQDPRKTPEWYDEQKRKLDPVIFAQEIEGDFFASTDMICIPRKYIEAAINFKLAKTGKKIAGLDVADEGGDKNALVIRHGYVVESITAWEHGDTTMTARRASVSASASSVDIINYDSVGVGAGVKGEFNSLKKNGQLKIAVNGVNTGQPPTNRRYENTDKLNSEMFLNLKAELWWKSRRRFEKTYEKVNGIKDWPDDELISIPDDKELITELCQLKYDFEDDGRIRIESKKQMASRGIKSPNKADAFMLAFSWAEERGVRARAL
jgi:hypothetical protein